MMNLLLTGLITLLCLGTASAIRCYQCSSDDDKGTPFDHCGVYNGFDKDYNIPVDCQGDESYSPGTFCVKLTRQGPRGFVWDGRWRQVIRRCGSVAEKGVTGVCNWGVYENGDYWEECYCSTDACNSSPQDIKPPSLLLTLGFMALLMRFIM